ncbi:hypothetical protein CYMTET_33320, partial [Cymbomonas tetramitiformis]
MAKLGGLVRAEEQRIEQQRAVLRKQMRRDATEHRTTFGLYEVVRALEIELSNNGPRSPSRPSSEAHGNTAATSDEEMMNATLMIEAAFENTVEVTDSPKESVLAQDAERVRSVTMRDWEPVENENQVLDLLLGSASSRRNTTTEQELRWAAARRRMRYKLRQARNRNAVRALVRGAMSKVLHSQVSLASAVVASAWSWHDLQKQNIIRGRLVRSGFYDKSGSLLTSMDQKYIHPQTKPTVFGRKVTNDIVARVAAITGAAHHNSTRERLEKQEMERCNGHGRREAGHCICDEGYLGDRCKKTHSECITTGGRIVTAEDAATMCLFTVESEDQPRSLYAYHLKCPVSRLTGELVCKFKDVEDVRGLPGIVNSEVYAAQGGCCGEQMCDDVDEESLESMCGVGWSKAMSRIIHDQVCRIMGDNFVRYQDWNSAEAGARFGTETEAHFWSNEVLPTV